MSKTSEYYKKNPKARKKRLEYQRKYNKRPEQRRKRSLLNKENRRRGTYGNGDKKDVSHRKDGSTFLEAQSKNRARNRGRA
jgi:hypothetical protein|tara:strand:- start:158 stop:400 length:243 start_codon:yes stop_codon:yes gene_type:complete